MEKAKQLAREIMANPNTEEDRMQKMEQLKPDINNLLHTYLPGDVTIEEMEVIACVINEMIWHPRKFLTDNKEGK